MKKKVISIMLAAALGASLFAAGCSSSDSSDTTEESSAAEESADEAEEELSAEEETADEEETEVFEETTITIYAAASLQTVLTELIDVYNETQPNVTIVGSYDSSGTLLTQIEESNGNGIDIFFSAAQKQMNSLEEDGLVVEGTRYDVVNNQVCVITYTGSGTAVTGLSDLGSASSLAIADGSVPVGKYTRQALVNSGILEEVDDVSTITTEEISTALGGVEINECANVSKVLQAVAEQSNEVGTVYYSDTYGYEDDVEILEYVSYDLTGDVIYPVAQVVNAEADDLENAAALDFVEFLISDEAAAIFDAYYFDTDVEH